MTQVSTENPARRILQRFILPADRDLDVMPLYVDVEAAVPTQTSCRWAIPRKLAISTRPPCVSRPPLGASCRSRTSLGATAPGGCRRTRFAR